MADNQTPSNTAPAVDSSSEASDTSVESQDSSEEGSEPEAVPEVVAPKKRLKELKLKVDGKELSEKLPFEIDDNPEAVEYFTRQLQLAKMGQKRAQDFSALEKQIFSFINELKTNPRKVLSDPTIGLDIKKLAAEVIEEEINNSKKSPEQLQREQLEAELKAAREDAKKKEEEYSKKEFERLQKTEMERYDMQMSKAIEGSDLPKSPYVVKKMADYMLLGLQNNIDLTPEDILPLVKEEIQSDIKQMFGAMPDEIIESIVGKDVFSRIRKKNITNAKKLPPVPVNKSIKDIGVNKQEKAKPVAKKTFKDFFGV